MLNKMQIIMKMKMQMKLIDEKKNLKLPWNDQQYKCYTVNDNGNERWYRNDN